jgi:hypothetical protein
MTSAKYQVGIGARAICDRIQAGEIRGEPAFTVLLRHVG